MNVMTLRRNSKMIDTKYNTSVAATKFFFFFFFLKACTELIGMPPWQRFLFIWPLFNPYVDFCCLIFWIKFKDQKMLHWHWWCVNSCIFFHNKIIISNILIKYNHKSMGMVWLIYWLLITLKERVLSLTWGEPVTWHCTLCPLASVCMAVAEVPWTLEG